MWAGNFWPQDYWADNYWAKVGDTPPPVVGQSPRASRYRTGGRVDWVHPTLMLMAFGGWVWQA